MKILFLNAFYTPHVGGGAEVILRHRPKGCSGVVVRWQCWRPARMPD